MQSVAAPRIYPAPPAATSINPFPARLLSRGAALCSSREIRLGDEGCSGGGGCSSPRLLQPLISRSPAAGRETRWARRRKRFPFWSRVRVGVWFSSCMGMRAQIQHLSTGPGRCSWSPSCVCGEEAMTQPPPRHRGSAQPSTRLPLAAPGGSQYPPGGGAAATDRSRALPSPRLYLAPSKAGLPPPASPGKQGQGSGCPFTIRMCGGRAVLPDSGISR